MSRIHEALKKAEQERAFSQSQPVDVVPAVLEPPLETSLGSATSGSVMAGAAPAMLTQESLLSRTRQTPWTPDPKTMLFFGEDHPTGAEEFRTLRSRLYQVREKRSLSKLLIASPLSKEGKSFTAANLAQVIVRQRGKRALLIDADLRNPQLHNLLGAEPGPGLSEYLQSEIDEFSAIQRGPMEGLFLIPAGRKNDHPAELIANGRMKFLLSRLEPLFDWIILDSPPAIAVSDAGLIANYCDGVLMVVRANATPFDIAKKARQEFSDNQLIGVVLNGLSELSPYSQYYYDAYGQPNGKEKG